MISCPKCNKELEDGVTVCDACGAEISAKKECPKCGAKNDANFAFCQSCGESLEVKNESNASVDPAPTGEKKKSVKKKRAIWLGGIAFVLTVAILCVSIIGIGKDSPIAYMKDNEIFISNGDDPWQLSTMLFKNSSIGNTAAGNYAYSIANYSTLSKNGKILFFPDRIVENSTGYSLYYRYVNDADCDPVKIASYVSSYTVNEKASVVTYKNVENGGLYQYNLKKDETKKIASDVSSFRVSKDGKIVYFTNFECGLYIYNEKDEKTKIDNNVQYIVDASEDRKTVYYLKENELFKKEEGLEKEKIASDVSSVLKVYEDGKIYFFKSDRIESSLMDYVIDEQKSADAAMTMPQEPIEPFSGDYSNQAEFDAAYAEYLEAYDVYVEKLAEYQEKLVRDALREELIQRMVDRTSVSLYLYNGKSVEKVANEYAGYESYASKAPVIIFKVYNEANVDKINMADIVDVDAAEAYIRATFSSCYDRYIALGSDVSMLEQSTAHSFKINAKGNTIFYVDDIPENKSYGQLYQIKIVDGKVNKAELYDSDVSVNFNRFASDDVYMYFKDVDGTDSHGDLYYNKKKIDFDVYANSVSYDKDNEMFVYFTNYDQVGSFGTLKVYDNGRVEKVSDDVYRFVICFNGEVVYLYDYSLNYRKGDLFSYKNGKKQKTDTDVSEIISYNYFD